MPTYTVQAKRTDWVYLEAEFEADNLEHAKRVAWDLEEEDFEFLDTDTADFDVDPSTVTEKS